MTDTEKHLQIGNRRYIGCKAGLADWMMSVIKENTHAVSSFYDLFAGTDVIDDKALKSGGYDTAIVNDFLLSNKITKKNDCLHSRKTKRSKGYSANTRCDGLTRRVHGG